MTPPVFGFSLQPLTLTHYHFAHFATSHAPSSRSCGMVYKRCHFNG